MRHTPKTLILLLLMSIATTGCTLTKPDSQPTSSSFAPKSAEALRPTKPQILTIGDSVMTWNTLSGQSIPQTLAHELGEMVMSRAVPGAKISLSRRTLIGMSIPGQFINQRWDTVVMNGGGNDLLQGCGCNRCDNVLDMLISADGKRGKIPALVKYGVLPVSNNAVFVGYLRTPGTVSVVEGCADEAAELEKRLQRLDRAEPRFRFVSVSDIVPDGSSEYHSIDTFHPSVKGSKAIAQRVAGVIQQMRR